MATECKNISIIRSLVVIISLIPFLLKAQNIPSIGRNNLLEIANWNLEWFGKTTAGFGPDDDSLQQALVAQVIVASDADIWAFCEISDKKAYDTLTKKLSSYSSTIASYLPEQKTALFWKNDMFNLLSAGHIGTAQKDSFSTMRFPLEIILLPKKDIGIDTLVLIVIHLKANTGSDSLKMLAYNSRLRSAEWLRMYLNGRRKHNHCVVLGDWNDDLDVSIYKSLPSPFAALQNTQFPFVFTSRILSDAGIGTTVSYPDAIDHQLVSKVLAAKYLKDSTLIWKLDKVIPAYAKNCSDHYPVYSYFNTWATNLISTEVENNALIIPNPVADNFYIRNCPQDCSLLIRDFQGRQIYYLEYYSGEPISLEGIVPGLYLLTLSNKNKQINFNISKL